MLQHKARWIYFLTILDMSLVEILLQSCKYVIFDPQEVVLEVKRMKLDPSTTAFMTNRMLTEQFTEIIREKKNRHIIYVCRKSDPVEILKAVETSAKKLSPTSKFYFNLISNKEEYLKLNNFYAVYIQ